ncbi:MAG: urease accessory protein UreF [Alphaproteobacteria bacterium]|nr:urease accessory protein UreF [Alphaproteobacteria bacterium]
MSTDALKLLAALQHGDSFFPSGGVAFSLGLEALRDDGRVNDAAGVERMIAAQITDRWASCDRAFIAAAYGAPDLDRVIALDHRLDAMTLPRELREGSRRNGGALLRVHAELGTPRATDYRAMVRSDAAPGHLPIVQGLVLSGVGLGRDEALGIAAHTFTVGLLAAALRLGLIGHVKAQAALHRLHAVIEAALNTPLPAPEEAHTFTPLTEIAVMRHETLSGRLFAN